MSHLITKLVGRMYGAVPEMTVGHLPEIPEQLSVIVGTNGQQGGDSGHGGNAVIEFKADSGMNHVRILNKNGDTLFSGDMSFDDISVQIIVQGDWEIAGLMSAIIEVGKSCEKIIEPVIERLHDKVSSERNEFARKEAERSLKARQLLQQIEDQISEFKKVNL